VVPKDALGIKLQAVIKIAVNVKAQKVPMVFNVARIRGMMHEREKEATPIS
tara:strand:- start:614 stop:766 length:153 start_codon:yes stop_codon:yes gene_type:complete